MGDYQFKKKRVDASVSRATPKPVATVQEFHVHCRNCAQAGALSGDMSVRYTPFEVVVDCANCHRTVAVFHRT